MHLFRIGSVTECILSCEVIKAAIKRFCGSLGKLFEYLKICGKTILGQYYFRLQVGGIAWLNLFPYKTRAEPKQGAGFHEKKSYFGFFYAVLYFSL